MGHPPADSSKKRTQYSDSENDNESSSESGEVPPVKKMKTSIAPQTITTGIFTVIFFKNFLKIL